MAFGLAVGLVIVVAVIALVSSHLLFICAPNEILVFSGRGRAFRIPLLETVAWMDGRLYARSAARDRRRRAARSPSCRRRRTRKAVAMTEQHADMFGEWEATSLR